MRICVPESGGNIIFEKRIGDVVIKANDKYKKTKTLQDVADLLNGGVDLGVEFFISKTKENREKNDEKQRYINIFRKASQSTRNSCK